jgi:uncharacterized protein YjbI with pentapeptide repeats
LVQPEIRELFNDLSEEMSKMGWDMNNCENISYKKQVGGIEDNDPNFQKLRADTGKALELIDAENRLEALEKKLAILEFLPDLYKKSFENMGKLPQSELDWVRNELDTLYEDLEDEMQAMGWKTNEFPPAPKLESQYAFNLEDAKKQFEEIEKKLNWRREHSAEYVKKSLENEAEIHNVTLNEEILGEKFLTRGESEDVPRASKKTVIWNEKGLNAKVWKERERIMEETTKDIGKRLPDATDPITAHLEEISTPRIDADSVTFQVGNNGIKETQLLEILEAHKKWLIGDPKGCKANLSGADLRGANLYQANLSETDLSGANLSKADLRRSNLTKANLSEADLQGANLFMADLREANLHKVHLHRSHLVMANLQKINWDGADLYGASLFKTRLFGENLSNVNLFRANLSEADLRETNLSNADLHESDLRETFLHAVNLRGADLRKSVLCSSTLSECDLRDTDLSGADLRVTKLTSSSFENANLSHANLSGAKWENVELGRANLSNAQMLETNLQGAKLGEAILSGANLHDAILEDAELQGAKLDMSDLSRGALQRSDLTDADLSGAKMIAVNLSGANLKGAILRRADLTKANLSGARLRGANMSDANLDGTNIAGATFPSTAAIPFDTGQKITFYPDSGKAASVTGYIVKYDEKALTLDSGGKKLKILRNKGDIEILPIGPDRRQENETERFPKRNFHKRDAVLER